MKIGSTNEREDATARAAFLEEKLRILDDTPHGGKLRLFVLAEYSFLRALYDNKSLTFSLYKIELLNGKQYLMHAVSQEGAITQLKAVLAGGFSLESENIIELNSVKAA